MLSLDVRKFHLMYIWIFLKREEEEKKYPPPPSQLHLDVWLMSISQVCLHDGAVSD